MLSHKTLILLDLLADQLILQFEYLRLLRLAAFHQLFMSFDHCLLSLLLIYSLTLEFSIHALEYLQDVSIIRFDLK